MRIIGNGVDEDEKDETNDENSDDEEVSIAQVVWDLMLSEEGQQRLAEDAAKNTFEQVMLRLDTKLSEIQTALVKIEVLDECSYIVDKAPSYFNVDTAECKTLLYRQLTTELGMLVERLEFKYKHFFGLK